jgi:hypothetical protein
VASALEGGIKNRKRTRKIISSRPEKISRILCRAFTPISPLAHKVFNHIKKCADYAKRKEPADGGMRNQSAILIPKAKIAS